MPHKVFEHTATFEQIKDAALRTRCGKIDHEVVRSMTNKEQLLAYLQSRECPALKYLEAKLLMGREYLDGAEVPQKYRGKY
jgi:hypothetical protein